MCTHAWDVLLLTATNALLSWRKRSPPACLRRDSLLHVGALLRLVREALLRRGGSLGDLEAVLVCPLLLPPADTVTRCGATSCDHSPRVDVNASRSTWASPHSAVTQQDVNMARCGNGDWAPA